MINPPRDGQEAKETRALNQRGQQKWRRPGTRPERGKEGSRREEIKLGRGRRASGAAGGGGACRPAGRRGTRWGGARRQVAGGAAHTTASAGLPATTRPQPRAEHAWWRRRPRVLGEAASPSGTHRAPVAAASKATDGRQPPCKTRATLCSFLRSSFKKMESYFCC